ncbi:alkaline phosphatase family protein [Sediminicola luteus]|uniref:Alkaline phosphatase family protein n=1 Tax=Sediminicola luteus TaxID=319238 RepID=A0A2A4GAK0_9FLAO|nr:nucleotide pyrophosphatase/phosphodiesterase family protein [Sediminicola luteus]PCE65000.1 alkaline phosphatase family protein [Sediminicola luteus]
MNKTVVINIVGLSQKLIGEHTPFIQAFQDRGKGATIKPVLPAVTCTAQSTYLTGKWPQEHGIVANGWYFKDECEVKLWRQSNKLVEAPKIWDELKALDPNFSCANMFWWYNMYSTVDFSATPRPNYLADGRKTPDFYAHPAELRDGLKQELGEFPLFHFWGPKTSIKSSQWIADASIHTDKKHDPTLTFIYLPHLDYNVQRHGNDFSKIAKDLQEVDGVVAQLVDYYEAKGARVVLLSEYGITDVDTPIHINRMLRAANLLQIRVERGLELLDAGASKAFAMADHQIAHIYLNDPGVKEMVLQVLQGQAGIAQVLHGDALEEYRLNHDRCGDIVLVAEENAWFTYYFWEYDAVAPDYARMVDIHKKPGYDPVEMFTDPQDPFVVPKIIGKLIKKKLGFRTVMDVIPLKPELVKGSHGCIPKKKEDHPVFITNHLDCQFPEGLEAVGVYDLLKRHIVDQ